MRDVVHHHGGFALVAALLLVAAAGIVTATVLQTTSTEVQISRNHKQTVQDFYAAEAGLAEARARLWKAPGTAASFIGDAGSWSDPLWTAYITASADWSPSVDPEYAPHHTNVIPVPGNPDNTLVRLNSLQTTLPYWVKIRHKTEYDAERDGHAVSTPHYVDRDGRTSRHNKNNRGNVVYFGYPSKTSVVPVAFTAAAPAPWLPVETIMARGRHTGGAVALTQDILHPPGPPQVGALYASGNVTIHGGSGVVNGHDACAMAGGLPPVLAGGTVDVAKAVEPHLRFDGVPASPQSHAIGLHLDAALTSLGGGAAALTTHQISRQLGTAHVPLVFLASGDAAASTSGIRIRHTRGDGILLVDGNASLEGEVQWGGMILVTGTVWLRGEGNGIVIRGGLWAGRINQERGTLTVTYDSCLLRAALLAVPVQARNWKEVF